MPKPPQNNTTFTSVSFARLIQPETAQMYRLGVEFSSARKPWRLSFSARHERPIAVLLRDNRREQRPCDIKERIVKPSAPGRARSVKSGGHIIHFFVFFQGLVAVRTFLRHEDHPPVFRTQFCSVPFAKSLRSRSEVENHIEHRSPGATNQLGLECGSLLKVHTADSSLLNAKSHICLDRQKVYTLFGKLSSAPCAHEPAPIIFVRAGINYFCAVQAGFSKMHDSLPFPWVRLWCAKG